jgi:hypothetical protein
VVKGTNQQVQARILAVYDWLLQGKTRQRIIRLCAEKYQVGERQTDTYIQRASELIKEELLRDKSVIKSTVLTKQVELYELAVAKGDYETARKILADFTKLNDLENPQHHVIEQTNIHKEIKSEPTENLLNLVKKIK